MTREEAKNKVFENREGEIFYEDTYKFIDKIYDDLESRTCENCMYFYEPELTTNIYRCESGVITIEDSEVTKDFGCLKFERKDK